jgi:shikimate kinase
VGKTVARRLNRKFLDSDHVIEERIGGPIRSFFDSHGEQAFRDLESEVIDELTQVDNAIIATGGGAVLREKNRQLLHARTHVVYLRTSPQELYRRLRHDTQRPLLQVQDPLAKLRDLFNEREPLYREVAHFVVDTGRPSVPSLVNMLLMQLELAGVLPQDPLPDPGAASPKG